MALTGSMRDVARQKAPRKTQGKLTTREAVAEVAQYLIGYRGMRNIDVIAATPMLKQTQFYNIMRGDVVSDVKLATLAGILSTPAEPLPVSTFRLMVAGDVKAIERLTMPQHIKDYILEVLSTSEMPHQRRTTDS